MEINLGTISVKKKINIGDIKIGTKKIYPTLENLRVTPSGKIQEFKHPNSYGYDGVIVNAVESKELEIMPSTEEQINEGLFKKVIVAGDSNLIPENINQEVEIFGVKGTAELRGEENAVLDGNLITTNSSAANYALKKMLKKIPVINTSQWTNMNQMFYECNNLTEIPQLDTKNATEMDCMFYNCNNLTKIPQLDTSNVINMSRMFYHCNNLTEIPQLDTSNVTCVRDMFSYCYQLVNIGGFVNLGKGFTQKSDNCSSYSLGLSSSQQLTHESLMNVINNLYDLNLTYDVANGGTLYTQKLTLGSTNVAKLTAEEIEIATNKGWTIN